jgi:DNA invertase Pin-like site-specific DNA recombinase
VIVGYLRVSSEQQGADGYGLDAQAEAITRACEARGWEAPRLVREVASASQDARKRPVLVRAINDLEDDDETGVLMVARLDRLTRSVGSFALLVDRAARKGWDLVCLDPAVDMSTPYGRAMAGMAAVFAQLERELISQRTKEGLAAARARGAGIPEGKLTADVLAEARALMDEGASLRRVARMFGVQHTSLLRALQRQAAQAGTGS